MTDTSFPPHSVAELRAFSARWGSDRLLVQGAGGNTSFKLGDRMMIKASGKWLERAERDDVFVTVTLDDLRVVDSTGHPPLRASIETSLHKLMPHTCVAHFHMVDALAYAVRTDAQAALAARLDGLAWAWVPYAKPGDELAAAVAAAVGGDRAPDILVLGNHGLVVGGDDAAAVDALMREARQRLATPSRGSVGERDQQSAIGQALGLVPVSVPDAHLAADPSNLAFATRGSLYPDHVVFLGRGATAVEDGTLPPDAQSILFLVPGVGAFLPPGVPQEAHEMAGCLGAIVSRISAGATLNVLSAAQEDDLMQWEAEAYRKSLATV